MPYKLGLILKQEVPVAAPRCEPDSTIPVCSTKDLACMHACNVLQLITDDNCSSYYTYTHVYTQLLPFMPSINAIGLHLPKADSATSSA